jgi:REP element-mobilizing transposase RayT
LNGPGGVTISPPVVTSAKAVYRNDSDRFHFLELLSEATERFAVRIHAYVLMDNQFHLMVETPEADLSRAMQWLKSP